MVKYENRMHASKQGFNDAFTTEGLNFGVLELPLQKRATYCSLFFRSDTNLLSIIQLPFINKIFF